MAMRLSQAAMIMFGAGSLEVLGEQLKMLGSKKAIIITDKGVTGAGVTAKVEGVIKGAGVECAVFDGCLADAPSHTVPLAAKAARDAGLRIDVEAPNPNAPSMTAALEQYIKEFNKKK